MLRTISLLAAALLTIALHAEEKPVTPVYGWSHSLNTQLTLTQTGYTDWAQGGENSLAYAFTLDGKETNDLEKTNWTTAYKFAFGEARLGGKAMRKTDDAIFLESILTYKVGTVINPYASVSFKSQFALGNTYANDGTATPVSRFFDPAFLTQGVGVGYQPINEVKTRLGLAMREVFTSQFNQYADDPATPQIEKSKSDGGFQLGVDVKWNLDDNLLWTSKLDIFDAMRKLDVLIVYWDNTFAAKISKIISVNFCVNIINERAITPRTQIKEALGLAIGYSFF